MEYLPRSNAEPREGVAEHFRSSMPLTVLLGTVLFVQLGCGSSPERRAQKLYEQVQRNESPSDAVRALARMGPPGRPMLFRLLEDEEDATRYLAAVNLRARGEDVAAALEKAARYDPDPNVQLEAIRGLGYTASPRAMRALRELGANHWHAQSSLKRFGQPGYAALMEDFEAEPSPEKKAQRLWVLCGNGTRNDQRVREVLFQASSDPAWEVRAGAANCYPRIFRADAIPMLEPLLRDRVAEVRVAAALELAELGNKDGIEPMKQLVKNELLPPKLRSSALLAMGRAPDRSQLEFYRQLIYNDSSLDVRRAAAEAVRRLFPHHDDPEYENYQKFLSARSN